MSDSVNERTEIDGSGRKNSGLAALTLTQFLGALNDNILKGVVMYMVIDGAWAGMLGDGGQGYVSLCLTVPFLMISGFAGEVADRHSKRTISVWMKYAEVPIAFVAAVGFVTDNLWITLSSLLALSAQSAVFGPAKYGMIPELVPPSRLSQANGLINMMTNVAVLVGTIAAGIIADKYSPQEASTAGQLWLPGATLLCVAAAGVAAVMFLPRLPAGNPEIRYSRNPVRVYLKTIQSMSRSPLLLIVLADGYFYLLAGLALLILPEYTVVLARYAVSRSEVSILLAILGIAIGLGSAVAGFVSGRGIKPVLIPIGAAGLTISFVLLGTIPPTLPDMAEGIRIVASSHAMFILFAGVSAGFYLIPLQSLIQFRSSPEERGQVLGTHGAIAFLFLSIASLVYPIIRPLFGTVEGELKTGEPQHPEKIFLICAALMVLGAGVLLWKLKQKGLTLAPVADD